MQKCKMQNARNADPTTNDTVTRPSARLKRLGVGGLVPLVQQRQERGEGTKWPSITLLLDGLARARAGFESRAIDVESPATVRGASSVGHETQVALCRVVWHRRARCCECVRRVAEASGEHAQAGAVHLLLCPREDSHDHRGAHGLWSACVGERRRGALDGGPNLKQVTHKLAFFS